MWPSYRAQALLYVLALAPLFGTAFAVDSSSTPVTKTITTTQLATHRSGASESVVSRTRTETAIVSGSSTHFLHESESRSHRHASATPTLSAYSALASVASGSLASSSAASSILSSSSVIPSSLSSLSSLSSSSVDASSTDPVANSPSPSPSPSPTQVPIDSSAPPPATPQSDLSHSSGMSHTAKLGLTAGLAVSLGLLAAGTAFALARRARQRRVPRFDLETQTDAGLMPTGSRETVGRPVLPRDTIASFGALPRNTIASFSGLAGSVPGSPEDEKPGGRRI